MDKIARLFAEISADNSKFKSTMNQTDSILKGSASRFSNFTTGIVQGFGQAFGQATISSIKNVGSAFAGVVGGAANTEQQVADIQSILQATDEEAAKIKTLLNDLAVNPQLKVSLADAGSLTEMLARNGVNAKDIIDSMAKSTILLSNATKGDYAQAADVLTDVMALWKDLGLTSEQAVDSITSVTNKSKLNLNEYQYAISNVAGAASNLKIPFEQVNDALIATASYFKSGRVQGTSFNAFLTRLVPTTETAQEAFTKLGLRVDGVNQLFDETGTLKDFGQIAGMLQRAISGLSDETAIELLSAAFGTTATDFLLGIAKTGEEGLKAIRAEASKVSAEANAAVVTDTTLAKWETFKDTLIGIGNLIGDKFLPGLKRLVSGLLDLVTLNREDFVGAFDGLAQSFELFVSSILDNQDLIKAGISNLIKGFSNLVVRLPELFNWLLNTKSAFSSLYKTLSDVGFNIATVFRNIFHTITRGMPSFDFRALFDTIKDFGLNDSALNQLEYLGWVIINSLRIGLTNAAKAYLSPAFLDVFKMLLDAGNSVANMFKSIFSTLTQGMPSFDFKALFDTIKDFGLNDSALTQLEYLGWAIINSVKIGFNNALEAYLKPAFYSFVDWLKSPETHQRALDAIKNTWNFFSEWANTIWTNLKPVINEAWNNLSSWVTDSSKRSQLLKAVSDSWSSFTTWASGVWQNISPHLNNLWSNLTSWITDSSKRTIMHQNLMQRWEGFRLWVGDIWGTWLAPKLLDIWKWTNDFIVRYVPSFKAWKNAVVNFTTDAYNQFKNNFPQMEDSVTSLSNTVLAEVPKIAESYNRLWNSIYGGSNGVSGNSFANVVTNIFTTITESLGGMLKYLRNTLDLLNVFVEATKAAFSGDFATYLGLRNQFNDLISEYGNIYDTQRNTIQNIWQGNPEQQINVVLSQNGELSSMSRQQLEELARLLQQQLSLQGIRPTP